MARVCADPLGLEHTNRCRVRVRVGPNGAVVRKLLRVLAARARCGLTAGLLAALACSGCAANHLKNSTLATANTLGDLQYRMVLDNLAMLSVYPQMLPWAVKLGSGIVQVNESIEGAIGVPALVWHDVYQAVRFRAMVRPGRMTTAQWSFQPVTEPSDLQKLQAAYLKALGVTVPSGLVKGLDIPTGWLSVGSADEVPANAVFVGSYQNRRVWVTPDHLDGLSRFTLAVLALLRLQPSQNAVGSHILISP